MLNVLRRLLEKREDRKRIAMLWAGAKKIDAEYDERLKAVAKEKGRYSDAYQQLDSEAWYERSQFTDEIEEIENKWLLAEARKYYLDLSDIPPPPEGVDSHWERGHFGNKFLSSTASKALGKLIYKARKEHAKEWRENVAFRFGIGAGIVGMLLTGYNSFTSQKISDLTNRVSVLEKAPNSTDLANRMSVLEKAAAASDLAKRVTALEKVSPSSQGKAKKK